MKVIDRILGVLPSASTGSVAGVCWGNNGRKIKMNSLYRIGNESRLRYSRPVSVFAFEEALVDAIKGIVVVHVDCPDEFFTLPDGKRRKVQTMHAWAIEDHQLVPKNAEWCLIANCKKSNNEFRNPLPHVRCQGAWEIPAAGASWDSLFTDS